MRLQSQLAAENKQLRSRLEALQREASALAAAPAAVAMPAPAAAQFVWPQQQGQQGQVPAVLPTQQMQQAQQVQQMQQAQQQYPQHASQLQSLPAPPFASGAQQQAPLLQTPPQPGSMTYMQGPGGL